MLPILCMCMVQPNLKLSYQIKLGKSTYDDDFFVTWLLYMYVNIDLIITSDLNTSASLV